jgi:3-dehydroquinate synthase
MNKLQLNSNIHDYEVLFEKDFKFIKELITLKNSAFVIDKNVYKLYYQHFKAIKKEQLFLLDAIEEKKTLKSVEKIYTFLAKFNAKKNITLISFGGGITQDITGFVSSTLYRGIKWLFIPTTFLAQADSCIGSKTSLNYKKYKNIIGGFYPPHKIYIQPEFLNTLTTKDFYSGIGEIVKFSLLEEKYPKDFKTIIQMIKDVKENKNRLNSIKRTMKIKKAYIDEDEFDTGKRNLFNYGHCFGHALENSSHYKVPHGIAVTIGIIYANIVALNRSLLSKKVYDFLNKELLLCNIHIKLKKRYFDKDILLESMKNDKKRVGKDLTIIIPCNDDIQAIKINDLTRNEFEQTFKHLLKDLKLI